MADPIGKLALGLMTGFLFGFLLQKGYVTKYPVIVGQFLLRDFTLERRNFTGRTVNELFGLPHVDQRRHTTPLPHLRQLE